MRRHLWSLLRGFVLSLGSLCVLVAGPTTWALTSPQTPWQSNAYGSLSTNISWNYAMGYHFTPLVDGQITALGGFFNGAKAVKLFDRSSGALLASVSVTSANTWSYTIITPVTVRAGTTYTVAVYLAGSGGSRRSSLSPALPRTFGDIRIDASTYASTSSNASARPTNSITTTMYGQADIQFVPNLPPTIDAGSDRTVAPGQLLAVRITTNDLEGQVVQLTATDLPPEGRVARLGDVTFNGTLSSLDAAWVLQYIAGTRTFSEEQVLLADLTGDGTTSSLDATRILQVSVNINPLPNVFYAFWRPTAADVGSSRTIRFTATDAIGLTATAQIRVDVVGDVTPPQISAIGVTGITSTGASLNWTTNEAAVCTVRCGTSPSPATQCATTPSGTAHAAALSGLNGSTLYYVSVTCQDTAGNTSAAATTSLTTAGSTVPTQPSVVTINGRQLLLQKRLPNGTLAPAAPYVIRGVDWSPASRNTAGGGLPSTRRPEYGKGYLTDIPLLKAMNVNTVRLFFDPGLATDSGLTVSGLTIMDEFYRNGIMVIMTVDDGANNTTRIAPVVQQYKDHPAILMWSLGSEWNINRYFGVAASVPDAAQRTQTAAALIKTLESVASRHPIVSSYGEIDFGGPDTQLAATQNYINNVCTSVDVWSLNLYRGDSFGALWTQWASISTKPMFLGEFGVDAFHAILLVNPAPGTVNEAEQASWDLLLWNDIARNFSAQNPAKMALGGTVFEWNDEWWKVSPPGSQQTSGWFSGGFPDGMGNEEYFGILDIDRTPRQVYAALQNGFRPDYVPPPAPTAVTFRVVSRGHLADEYGFQYGVARFYQGGTLLYEKTGGGGGGRSFNIAAINPSTGALVQPITNFDVWYGGPPAVAAMQSFVNGLPNGTLVLIAVADEAGLTVNHLQPCTPKPYQYVQDAYQLMEGLGSTQIRNYCYWGSWALAAVKGQGTALAEGLKNDTIGDPPGELVELTVPFNLQSP